MVPGVQKNDFYNFSRFFYEKMAGNSGISSETTIPGISSETAAPWYLERDGGAHIDDAETLHIDPDSRQAT